MQSGIKASSDLHNAFASFTSSPTLFALPVTIASESLTPLSPIAFPSSSSPDFASSLPLLEPHLAPKTPIFLLLRQPSSSAEAGFSSLVAVTYIPSTAPVRSKTLFASTRATLVRELGSEKFSDNLFCTDAAEVLDVKEWEGRGGRGVWKRGGRGGGSGAAAHDDLLTAQERDLQNVKRAEDEERHGTQGRELMGMGAGKSNGGGSGGIKMKMEDQAKGALWALGQEKGDEGGRAVQLGIDILTETLTLSFSSSGLSPSDLSSRIPSDKPSYTFYHYPSSTAIVFIYTCPSSSKIKERMMYASCRAGLLDIAKSEDVEVTKRIEAGGPDEVTAETLREEVTPRTDEAAGKRQGFARPKRPGKR